MVSRTAGRATARQRACCSWSCQHDLALVGRQKVPPSCPHPTPPPHLDFSQVRDKFAPITCISPSPSGHFMAVGTATGATVVFDLRNEPSNPWFEVGYSSTLML